MIATVGMSLILVFGFDVYSNVGDSYQAIYIGYAFMLIATCLVIISQLIFHCKFVVQCCEGIAVFYNDCTYMYYKALGWNEILFAEQFAIAQIFPLLNKLKIDISNKRIFIFTDNDITFKNIYTNESIPTYPSLIQTIKDNIFKLHPTSKILVCKVKSQIDDDPIYGNEVADKCAEKGRIVSTMSWIETPKLVTCFKWSHAHYYSSCSEKIFLWDDIGIGIS